MNKKIIFIILMIILTASLSAESDFEKWKKKQQDAFKSYMSEQEKAFSEMLKKEWKEFRTQAGFAADTEPKPDKQPAAVPDKKPEPQAETNGETGSGEGIAGNGLTDSEKGSEKKNLSSEKIKPASSSAGISDGTSAGASARKFEGSGSAAMTGSSDIKPGTAKTADSGNEGNPGLLYPEKKEDGLKYIDTDFYGTQLSVPVPEDLKIKESSGSISNKSISAFFEYYSEQKMDRTISFIRKLRTDSGMNGWSVLKISEKISDSLYKNKTDRILMLWFLLIKSDYDVKIAYSSENIYLLYVPEVKVYASPFITENKKNYYFYNKSDSKNERIRTYSDDFVKNPEAVRLMPENPEIFKISPQKRNISFRYGRKDYPVNLEYNSSLIKYYAEYPQLDISCYFKENISEKAASSYKKSLYPYIKGMNEQEAVQFLLTFVQTGFKYKTDGSQFGYEKPMFPDESLHYPYIDCEDRASLFISIVKELTGLEAVALDYPGHISSAVCFRGNVKGDYIKYRGKKYTVCDPTYINAYIGMTMPDYKNVKPVIIEAGK